MEDELEMRKAEVWALRNYYQTTSKALSILEPALKLIKAKPYINEKEQKALNILLESRNER